MTKPPARATRFGIISRPVVVKPVMVKTGLFANKGLRNTTTHHKGLRETDGANGSSGLTITISGEFQSVTYHADATVPCKSDGISAAQREAFEVSKEFVRGMLPTMRGLLSKLVQEKRKIYGDR